MGGGFGIKYIVYDELFKIEKFIEVIVEEVEEFCSLRGLKKLFVVLESGCLIVGEVGIIFYIIGSIKEILNVRNYVFVDGGMIDNLCYVLY